MFKRISQIELVKDIKQVVSFMKMSGVRLKFFISSLTLSIGLTLFNLYTVSLLFPLVDGVIKGNFDNVKRLKMVGAIVAHYPNIFSTSLQLFLLLVFWVYLTIIIKNVLQYGAFLSTQYQAKSATVKLRNVLFNKCLSFGKSFYDKNKLAYIHGVVTKSTGVIEGQFSLFQNFIIQIFLLVMYLAVMIRVSWKLTLISVISFPIVNFLTRKVIVRIRESLKLAETAGLNLRERVMDLLYCWPVIKAFSKEENEKMAFAAASDDEIEQSFKSQKIANLLMPIEDIGATTSTLLLALGMALVIYLDHSISPTGALVFFYLAQKIVPGMNSINNFRLGIINAGRAVDDINGLLKGNDDFIIKSGEKELADFQKGIEIKNLSFSYSHSSDSVLKNVSFFIPKGKMTAIVGPTGSGKSTIANLLLRFYDCPAGTIFFDGVDVREYKIDSLLKKMSFVSQEVLLFSNTIEHNIKYGSQKDISPEEIERVSRKTTVHDFVERLPQGYNTKLAERGNNFSGGEKQRISITRALLKDYEIFIMDEATSSLDGRTEHKIVEALEDFSGGKTLIVISHRLSTIRKADYIVYLEKGAVKESGTLEELLNLQGEFYKQWQAQKI